MELNVELPLRVKGKIVAQGLFARTDIAPSRESDLALVIMTDHENKRTWLDVVEVNGCMSQNQLAEADETATLGRVMIGGRTAHLFTAEQWEKWRSEQK